MKQTLHHYCTWKTRTTCQNQKITANIIKKTGATSTSYNADGDSGDFEPPLLLTTATASHRQTGTEAPQHHCEAHTKPENSLSLDVIRGRLVVNPGLVNLS